MFGLGAPELLVIAILFAILLAYPLPTIIAFARKHRQRFAILLLNLLTGWTIIGWIGALVMGCHSYAASEPELW